MKTKSPTDKKECLTNCKKDFSKEKVRPCPAKCYKRNTPPAPNNMEKQTTFCYCPKCNNELCNSNSFIKDTDLVYYKCSKCGTESKWNFDIAPAPILISPTDKKECGETHTCCNKRLKEEGEKARCCYCVPHKDCSLLEDIKSMPHSKRQKILTVEPSWNVSEWKKIGQQRGYWDYFLKSERQRLIKWAEEQWKDGAILPEDLIKYLNK